MKYIVYYVGTFYFYIFIRNIVWIKLGIYPDFILKTSNFTWNECEAHFSEIIKFA